MKGIILRLFFVLVVMDKLASQLLFKSLDGSYHLSDLDSDEEETEHTPVVQPVVPVKYVQYLKFVTYEKKVF